MKKIKTLKMPKTYGNISDTKSISLVSLEQRGQKRGKKQILNIQLVLLTARGPLSSQNNIQSSSEYSS